MNMFKATKVKTVEEYLDSAPIKQKELVLFLNNFIQKAVPKFGVYFASNMIGYGSFSYLNNKKEALKWPVIALAHHSQYVSIYVCSIDKGMYVAEKYKNELGKVKVGKSCINIKKLEDVNLPVLKQVLKEAEKNPGLTQYKK